MHRSQLSVLLISGEALFHSTRDLSPRKKNPATAAQALQTEIRTDTHHNPIRVAAWMWLAQADHIVQLDFWEHNNSLIFGFERPIKIVTVVHPRSLLLTHHRDDKSPNTHTDYPPRSRIITPA